MDPWDIVLSNIKIAEIAAEVMSQYTIGTYPKEDMLQDAIIGLFDAVCTFDATKGEWRSWLYSKARWAILDGMRQHRGEYRYHPDGPRKIPWLHGDINEDHADDVDDKVGIVQALRKLTTEQQREWAELVMQGLSGREIAALWHADESRPSQVKRHVRRVVARAFLSE